MPQKQLKRAKSLAGQTERKNKPMKAAKPYGSVVGCVRKNKKIMGINEVEGKMASVAKGSNETIQFVAAKVAVQAGRGRTKGIIKKKK